MLLRNGTFCCATSGLTAASVSAAARMTCGATLLLGGRAAFGGWVAGRADTRRADEQTRAVLDEGHLSARRTIGSIARLEAANANLGACRQRVAIEAAAQQRVRRRTFEG